MYICNSTYTILLKYNIILKVFIIKNIKWQPKIFHLNIIFLSFQENL